METAIKKIIKMFTPYGEGNFLDFDGKETIVAPNDRAAFGFDNNFPKQWLIEDYDFTEEEASWFIEQVNKLNEVK